MKPKVIVYKRVPKEVVNYLNQTCDAYYVDSEDPQFFEAVKDAQGIIGSGLFIDKEFLDMAPHLKIVSNVSVGYNNFDLEELTRRRIMATNTPDVLTDTTADLIFGLLLAAARRISELDTYVKKGEWKQHIGRDLFGVDVNKKKLGIIGMGRIGTAIAKRAHMGFDMEILYHNRSKNELAENLYRAKRCSLDDLLKTADFICLMTPLTYESYHLIGEREFNLMQKTAIFINGSRGETVDEQALIEALQSGKILGAGLDVFTKEPIEEDNPLLSLKQVVTVPHIGSAVEETRMKMAWLAAENIVKGLNNERPPSLINTF
ncbi:2-hydroxyacid dehydrogenase [Bacillus pinisoli]|uniref:2-hydroxyacid dehydrogenase n=1 Tax=Bacillus pinisoli TaxID=2901866 RepID=UPI001FF42969|nr:D-glycerate dehydrogenase [Bacillus pinisoli]